MYNIKESKLADKKDKKIRFIRSLFVVNILFFLTFILATCGWDGIESGAGVSEAPAQNIYIDASARDGGDGSIDNPCNEFSDINWTTGGNNSIEDWASEGYQVFINRD